MISDGFQERKKKKKKERNKFVSARSRWNKIVRVWILGARINKHGKINDHRWYRDVGPKRTLVGAELNDTIERTRLHYEEQRRTGDKQAQMGHFALR